MTTPQPCGAIRVVKWFEGMSQVEAWCSRTEGPCPYPGAGHALDRNGRHCVVDFAALNPAIVSADHHADGHGGMFPETCSLCLQECHPAIGRPSPVLAPGRLDELIRGGDDVL